MNLRQAAEALDEGRRVTLRVWGGSMTPKIESGATVTIDPLGVWDAPRKGDIVLAKVRGRFLLHLVSAVGDDKRVQISNNHGHVNGWASVVYGLVVGVQ